MTDKKRGAAAKLALLVATLIWGSSFVMMKDAADMIPPNLLLAMRFTAACAVLCAIYARRLSATLRKSVRSHLLAGVAAGACLFAAYCTQTYGLMRTTPGKNAFLTAVYVVMVPFLFWAVNRERPTSDNVIAAFMCVAGIGLVSLTESFSMGAGDLLTLLGGFFYACHIIVLSKAGKNCDPIIVSIIQFGVAAALAWSVSFAAEGVPRFAELPWSGSLVFSLSYLAIMCTAVALLLQTVGQKYTSPAAASLILCLESVFGVLFSCAFGQEIVTVRMVFGFCLILLSVLASELRPFSKLVRIIRLGIDESKLDS